MILQLIGPSYLSRSTFNNNRDLVNFYLEQDNSGGKSAWILMPSPGLTSFANYGGGLNVRGLYNYNGTCYGVINGKFFSVTSAGVFTILGSLVTAFGQVVIKSIQDQIMIVDGSKGYIYTCSTGVFAQITDVDFPANVSTVTSMLGRFIVCSPGTDKFFYSDLRNGLSWQALNFYRAESLEDNLVNCHFAGSVLLMFGEFTTEIWQADTGGTTNFLVNSPGTYIDYGLAAPKSLCQMENSLFGLTQNRYGTREILQTIDFDTKIISTPAVMDQISQYTTVSDAFGYTFQEKGHKFYRLIFPTENKGWDYDITTEQWNRIASFANSVPIRHVSNCYVNCYGKHLVGDYASGNIYQMTSNSYSDNGAPIIRTWQFPFVQDSENKRVTVYNFDLNMEMGVGLATGQGSAPTVSFQFSRDGGHTWYPERTRSPGAMGEYYKRAFWPVAGSGFIPYGKIQVSDPVYWSIVGATANIQPESKEG